MTTAVQNRTRLIDPPLKDKAVMGERCDVGRRGLVIFNFGCPS
jgi:hypothetical protein